VRTQLPDGVDQIPDGPGVLLWIIGETDEVMFIDREFKLEDHGAAILPYRGTWAIQDRGTLSGLYVDGYRSKARCLVPGMTIRIGVDRFAVLSVR
jgi:pSer/pThr/pTyr-binding forkhead associated (FHA) protein